MMSSRLATECNNPGEEISKKPLVDKKPLGGLQILTYLAIIQNVRTIEVVDVEVFRKIGNDFVDVFMDVVLD